VPPVEVPIDLGYAYSMSVNKEQINIFDVEYMEVG
jgi:hypothetical protein